MEDNKNNVSKPVFSKEEMERFDTFFGSDPDYALLGGFEINGNPVNIVVKDEKGDKNFKKEVVGEDENPEQIEFVFKVDAVYISAPTANLRELLSKPDKVHLAINHKLLYRGDGVFSVDGELTTIPPKELSIVVENDDTDETETMSFSDYLLALKDEEFDEGVAYEVMHVAFNDMLSKMLNVVKDFKKEDVVVIGDRYTYAFLKEFKNHSFLEMTETGEIPELDTLPPFNFCFIIVNSEETVFGNPELVAQRTKALMAAAKQDCASFVLYVEQDDSLPNDDFDIKEEQF